MFHQLSPYTGTTSLPTAQPQPQPQPPPAHLPAVPRLDLSRIPPAQHPAAFEYDSFVSRLTFNSKDLITTLTRVAGENLHNSDAIVAVLEQRILSAPPTVKLPMLYLLDSIVKNIAGPYIAVFRVNLFHTFTNAYSNTTPQVRMSMHRLLNTWPPVFGMEVVTAMRRRAADIDAASQPAIPPFIQPQAYQGLQMSRGLTMPQGLQMPPPHRPQSMPPYPPKPRPAVPLSRPMQPRPPPPPPSIVPHASVVAPPHVSPVVPAPSPGLRTTPPQAEPSFLQVQSLMQDISRKASMGVAPSNHQLFTINRLITTLLPTSHPHERNLLLTFQSQLRELPTRLASNARQQQFAPPPAAYQAPVQASDALSSLLRNPPPGLLAPTVQPHVSASLNDIRIPRHSLPPPPRRQLPQQPDLPNVLKFADLKSLSHAAAVRSLYADLPHLSKSDGMRFATKEKLREHLDWLFQRNRSKRARERGFTVGGSSRCWFDSIKKILGAENGKAGNEEEKGGIRKTREGVEVRGEDTKLSNAVVAIGASEKCEACQEEIDSFWSDEQQAWMLKDAMRTDDGEAYHRTCVESVSTPRYDGGGTDEGDVGRGEVKTEVEVKADTMSAEVRQKEDAPIVKAENEVSGTDSILGGEIRSKKRGRDDEHRTGGGLYWKEGLSVDDDASSVKKAKVEGFV